MWNKVGWSENYKKKILVVKLKGKMSLVRRFSIWDDDISQNVFWVGLNKPLCESAIDYSEYDGKGICESCAYWTLHHLTSWINWTNLMSLYESFLLLNMFQMLLHSSSGNGDCMWVYCSVKIDVYALASCLLVSVYLWVYWSVACYYIVLWMCSIVLCKGYHVPVWVCTGVLVRFGWSRVVSECRTYSHQLLRMNVITFETCWEIENFHSDSKLVQFIQQGNLCLQTR
jgi:hypothetical protein